MKKLLIILFALNFYAFMSFGQEKLFSRGSIKTGIAIGFNDGKNEIGMGTLFSIGYQRSYLKERLRLNPNLMSGGFMSLGITDVGQQYYRTSALGIDAYLDAVKYRSLSIFISSGVFVNYSRGLISNAYGPNHGPDYFFNFYYGANASAGLRVNPKKSRLAFELTPLSIYFGSDRFLLGLIKLGVDIKLNPSAKKSMSN